MHFTIKCHNLPEMNLIFGSLQPLQAGTFPVQWQHEHSQRWSQYYLHKYTKC